MTPTTLYTWRRRFEDQGPAGLLGHRRNTADSRLPEPTRRAILMMKESDPDWGQDRIHDMPLRSEGLQASAGAVQRVLVEAGYEVEPAATRPHGGGRGREAERHLSGLGRTGAILQPGWLVRLSRRARSRRHRAPLLLGDSFSGGLAAAAVDAVPYGYLDPSGTWVIKPRFEQAAPFRGGLALVVEDGGKSYGYVNRDGQTVYSFPRVRMDQGTLLVLVLCWAP